MATLPPDTLPVGSILAYAADTLDATLSTHWQFCQGGQMNKAQYPDLFAAIGYSNGSGADPNIFYLPNLQGYFLRGVDETGNVDVDAGSRITPSGAPAAYLPGSVQAYATAPGSLQVGIPYLPTGYNLIDEGGIGPAAYMMMAWNPGAIDFPLYFGGSKESVPVNTYMQYVIKVLPTVAIPIGSVMSYGGTGTQSPDPDDGLWAPCEGDFVRTSSRIYESLYGVIGGRYGMSTDLSQFKLPDLQGMFIRGVDINAGRDKNGNRIPPPGLPQGPTTVAGSTQSFGTGQATTPLLATLPHYPIGASIEVYETDGYDNVRGDWNSTAQNWTQGDLETRPVNANVQFFASLMTQQLSSDIIPVGTIIAIPGQGIPNRNYWLRCNGSSVLNTAYPQLFTACSTLWGTADAEHFNLPDLRGRFLRGVDNAIKGASGVDPDRFNRKSLYPGGSTLGTGSYQSFGTNFSSASININVPTRHWQNAATAVGPPVTAYNSGSVTCSVNGGDKETRPTNLAVQFYIKCTSVTEGIYITKRKSTKL
jgi:microcystin-dependent protein